MCVYVCAIINTNVKTFLVYSLQRCVLLMS